MTAMRRKFVSMPLAALLGIALLALPGCAMLRRRAAHRPPYVKVSAPIAYEIIRDNPSILILDLRAPQEFNGDTGHIFRAHNIPLDRLPFRLLEISTFRDDTFVAYCGTQKCAEEGMSILISSGFQDAVMIDGGIDSWIRKGFPTVLPGDIAGRAAERVENARGVQPAAADPATAIDSATAPPPPPPL
jgi:rhodanese-related sulfurtransferase